MYVAQDYALTTKSSGRPPSFRSRYRCIDEFQSAHHRIPLYTVESSGSHVGDSGEPRSFRPGLLSYVAALSLDSGQITRGWSGRKGDVDMVGFLLFTVLAGYCTRRGYMTLHCVCELQEDSGIGAGEIPVPEMTALIHAVCVDTRISSSLCSEHVQRRRSITGRGIRRLRI